MRILIAVMIIGSLCVFCVHAEEVNKNSAAVQVDEAMYNKDTVPIDNTYACQVGSVNACEVPVLLSKQFKKIEYYWSTKAKRWVSAGAQQAALQVLYDKIEDIRVDRQLKEMQGELDREHRSQMEEDMRDSMGRN